MSAVPSLVVFDLADCVWSPEMHTLDEIPTERDVVLGDLNGKGKGVSVMCCVGSM